MLTGFCQRLLKCFCKVSLSLCGVTSAMCLASVAQHCAVVFSGTLVRFKPVPSVAYTCSVGAISCPLVGVLAGQGVSSSWNLKQEYHACPSAKVSCV
jgi:hypothetical protein